MPHALISRALFMTPTYAVNLGAVQRADCIPSRRVPGCRVGSDHPGHDASKPRWHVRRVAVERVIGQRAPASDESLLDRLKVVCFPEEPAVQHLEEHHPNAVNIGIVADGACRFRLGRTVVIGSKHGPRSTGVVDHRGRPEVAQEGRHPIPIQQHVRWFDVSVDRSVVAQDIRECVQHLNGKIHGLLKRESVAVRGEQFRRYRPRTSA